MKILFAEDEQDLREVVSAYLEHQGHNVVSVENGKQALERAGCCAYDAIVMDVMMPVMDGFSAMKQMRAAGITAPAIFLTAKGSVSDRVEGLDAGADDYLIKPFHMEELNARLRALDRRKREYRIPTLSIGNVVLNMEASELSAHNSIGLSHREVLLLGMLIDNADRFLTAEELLKQAWACEHAGEDTLWLYISFLRAKLRSVRADVIIEGDRSHPLRLKVCANV